MNRTPQLRQNPFFKELRTKDLPTQEVQDQEVQNQEVQDQEVQNQEVQDREIQMQKLLIKKLLIFLEVEDPSTRSNLLKIQPKPFANSAGGSG